MKRALSQVNLEPALTAAAPPAKRPKSQPALQPLTHGALSALETESCEREASIASWVSCIHDEGMDSRPRLVAQVRRPKRSRTPSPVKKQPHCASPEYRNGIMKLAQVFVERDRELPVHVATHVRRILETATSVGDGDLADLARNYREKSRSLASKCVGEGEWRSSIYSGLLDLLSRRWSHVLELSASEKPWNKFLKPTVPQWNDITSSSQTWPLPRTMPANPPVFFTPSATVSNTDPSSSAASVTASDSSVDDRLQLSTPKPDVSLGLASDAINSTLGLPEDFLLRLQTDPTIPQPFCSDPHQVPIGLRFPFLIVEAKGSNTGGNLVHAQNQAAVGGASALNILEDLHARISPAEGADVAETFPAIIFSIVTEGPTYELWVHYKTGKEYHMHCLESWRTTLPGHAELLFRSIDRIMGWGAGIFKDDIVQSVGALWRDMCAPAE